MSKYYEVLEKLKQIESDYPLVYEWLQEKYLPEYMLLPQTGFQKMFNQEGWKMYDDESRFEAFVLKVGELGGLERPILDLCEDLRRDPDVWEYSVDKGIDVFTCGILKFEIGRVIGFFGGGATPTITESVLEESTLRSSLAYVKHYHTETKHRQEVLDYYTPTGDNNGH